MIATTSDDTPKERLWFYQKNHEANGPIDHSEFLALVTKGDIRPTTRVWCRELGPVWRMARDLKYLDVDEAMAAARQQALPPDNTEDIKKAVLTARSTFVGHILALVPAVSVAAALMFVKFSAYTTGYSKELAVVYYWIVFPIMGATFYRMDRQLLRSTYEQSPALGLLSFLSIPPVYFARRALIARNQPRSLPALASFSFLAPLFLHVYLIWA
ncbi:DUF4339 domain-containing protein [Rhodobacteraceae bacterium RKSG542]|uniref:DUF4339 domain-containing protein n=1 Tax=Pseudovibrio flavus TaxID=2529854 RepID=UPI0012BCC0B0|nr:DUF4339 domain-containing protein [Pseudovibrio flavus]MTI15992.1 DUF4339 domain-containing protein [Pseudovibrio flavus]